MRVVGNKIDSDLRNIPSFVNEYKSTIMYIAFNVRSEYFANGFIRRGATHFSQIN